MLSSIQSHSFFPFDSKSVRQQQSKPIGIPIQLEYSLLLNPDTASPKRLIPIRIINGLLRNCFLCLTNLING